MSDRFKSHVHWFQVSEYGFSVSNRYLSIVVFDKSSTLKCWGTHLSVFMNSFHMVSDRGTIWRLSEVVNVIRVTEINPTQMNLTVLYSTFRLQMEWIQIIHSSPLGKYMYFICEFTPRYTGICKCHATSGFRKYRTVLLYVVLVWAACWINSRIDGYLRHFGAYVALL